MEVIVNDFNSEDGNNEDSQNKIVDPSVINSTDKN